MARSLPSTVEWNAAMSVTTWPWVEVKWGQTSTVSPGPTW